MRKFIRKALVLMLSASMVMGEGAAVLAAETDFDALSAGSAEIEAEAAEDIVEAEEVEEADVLDEAAVEAVEEDALELEEEAGELEEVQETVEDGIETEEGEVPEVIDSSDQEATAEETQEVSMSGSDLIVSESAEEELSPVTTTVCDEVFVVKQKVDITGKFQSADVSTYKIDPAYKKYGKVGKKNGIFMAKKCMSDTSPQTVVVIGMNYSKVEVERLEITIIKPALSFGSDKKGTITPTTATIDAHDYLDTRDQKIDVYKWVSSDSDIASIDSDTGIITFNKKGAVEITAKFKPLSGTNTVSYKAKLNVQMQYFKATTQSVREGKQITYKLYYSGSETPEIYLSDDTHAMVVSATRTGAKYWTVKVRGLAVGKSYLYGKIGDLAAKMAVYVEEKKCTHSYELNGYRRTIKGRYMTKLSDEILKAVNKKREDTGHSTLSENTALTDAALLHAISYAYSSSTYGTSAYAKKCLDESGVKYEFYAVARTKNYYDLDSSKLDSLTGSTVFTKLYSSTAQKDYLKDDTYRSVGVGVFAKYSDDAYDVYAVVMYTD